MSQHNLFDDAVDLEEMGRRMTQALDASGLSVSQLSFRTEIQESGLRRYLKGETEPGATRLARIARVLGVNADWLLQNTDNPAPVPELWEPGDPDRRSGGGGGSNPEREGPSGGRSAARGTRARGRRAETRSAEEAAESLLEAVEEAAEHVQPPETAGRRRGSRRGDG